MQATTKSQAGHAADKQLFSAALVFLQFLASPDDVGDAICFIRGTMPPGAVVPLHSHAEPEILYLLDGAVQVYRSTERANGWTNAALGDVVIIPGSVKHALRNASSLPATLALVTKSQLYQFYRRPRRSRPLRSYLWMIFMRFRGPQALMDTSVYEE